MMRPSATYRLQFRNGMDFERASGLAPYLARLGISHLYASPLFAAAEGSTHGYDGIDFDRLEPSIGGEAGFARLTQALEQVGLRLLLDFVPNHMAAVETNRWWRSVLEWGPASPHAAVFDIDWTAPKLLLPLLGAGYGEALEEGAFGLRFDAAAGSLRFRFYDRELPLTPPSYALVLEASGDAALGELARRFAGSTADDAEALQRELAGLAASPAQAAALAEAVSEAAADAERLHAIHEAQVWRLAHWRLAREALSHRRFFEIAELIGLRVEDPAVFAKVHRRLFALIGEGLVHGVRLDHVDGLSDPKGYLDRFQEAVGEAGSHYLLVEKILEHGEPLRPHWAIAGTTGYEFAAALAGAFVERHGEAAMTSAYDSFIGRESDYAAEALAAKREIVEFNLASELADLTAMARGLAEESIATRDLGEDALRRAILEVLVSLDVYRSYVGKAGPDALDRAVIGRALAAAETSGQLGEPEALAFVGRLLLLECEAPLEPAAVLPFVTRFQQTSGPVMAKAIEDTLFYRYVRLIALNEVGGAPDRYGAPLADFHAAMTERQARQPGGLSATATHDTKRGEDARARLYGLSEMPEEWRRAVERWRGMNAPHRSDLPDGEAPEPAMEWMFYQALAGAWPPELVPEDALRDRPALLDDLRERLTAYMEKAAREAKQRTTWTNPNEDYEDALTRFVSRSLSPGTAGAFLADFARTCRPLWLAGALTGLSQLAVKLAAPGVPDIYQGCELWDFSLVDPDNRRPVDFALRARLLDSAGATDATTLLDDWLSGAPKMALLAAGLRARGRHPDLFAEGRYEALAVTGERARHVIAFRRCLQDAMALVVAPRFVLDLLAGADRPLVPPGRWGDTAVVLPEVPAGRPLRDLVTGARHEAGEPLRLSELLDGFPVAFLVAEGES
ncbi:MAG: malto-oligosyltrehalose synthase [Bacteroidota bacterium]